VQLAAAKNVKTACSSSHYIARRRIYTTNPFWAASNAWDVDYGGRWSRRQPVNLSVCPSRNFAVQTRLNVSRFCFEWRLSGTKGKHCTRCGPNFPTDLMRPSLWSSPNYFGHLLFFADCLRSPKVSHSRRQWHKQTQQQTAVHGSVLASVHTCKMKYSSSTLAALMFVNILPPPAPGTSLLTDISSTQGGRTGRVQAVYHIAGHSAIPQRQAYIKTSSAAIRAVPGLLFPNPAAAGLIIWLKCQGKKTIKELWNLNWHTQKLYFAANTVLTSVTNI